MPKKSVLISAVACAGLATVPTSAAAAPTAPAGFKLDTFATAPSAAATGPDDIAYMDGHVFVGWQNGVGTKGEPNPKTGQDDGTLVEYSRAGKALGTWRLKGKIDGMGGDAAADRLVVTVNEDGNSSLYTIAPSARADRQVRHFKYSPSPDSAATGGVLTGGGTDAVSVYRGGIYVSASNPMAKNATAVFRVRLEARKGIARLSKTFADDARATDAVSGEKVTLGLTDPDSNAVVPDSSARFGGDFALVSQADQELVFARGLRRDEAALTRLALTRGGSSASVDDIRWAARRRGNLYIVDNKTNTVYRLRGPFESGQAFGALDTVGGAPANTEVDTINLATGALSPLATGFGVVKGLVWVG
jgi:hypothetical protein